MNQALIQRAISRVMPSAVATGLLVSLATFQSSDANDFPDGFYSGNYQDLPGLTNLPCMAPPESDGSIQATEVKGLQEIAADELRHVLFETFYPQLDAGWRQGWRVLIQEPDGHGGYEAGTVYDVMGVESDSQSQMSRVRVRNLTV